MQGANVLSNHPLREFSLGLSLPNIHVLENLNSRAVHSVHGFCDFDTYAYIHKLPWTDVVNQC